MATLFEKVIQASPIAVQASNASQVKVVAITAGSNYIITLQSDTPLVFATFLEAQQAANELNIVLQPRLNELITKYENKIRLILAST